jgi:hypothetical protein
MANKELLDQSKNLRMVLTIKVSGTASPTKNTVVVFRSGQMVQGTTASGRMEWPMVGADLFMLKVMFMKVSGQKIRPTVKEFTLISMDLVTKDFGTKISNTALVLSSGLMVLNTREITTVE